MAVIKRVRELLGLKGAGPAMPAGRLVTAPGTAADARQPARAAAPPPSARNPSPPLGQAAGAADPRSPGRRPAMKTEGQPSHAVFEVDDEWFTEDEKARAARLALQRDLADFDFGLEDPAPFAPAVPEPVPVIAPAPVVLKAAAPEVTEEMLDQIAQRVVERMSSATLGADLREVIAASVRETVRSVVSETSERLVRDEIARIKARAERDSQ